jgi:predicted ABC-type ATPase
MAPRWALAHARRVPAPLCVIIAGPNGAGKTTFARAFLLKERRIRRFVNADLIAAGLSPLAPDDAAIAAGRLFLDEIDRLAREGESFAFETTLSGRGFARRLREWRDAGYVVEAHFLRLASPQLAIRRVQERVRQGGHSIPKADIIRRFARGLENFDRVYKPLCDSWSLYDNSGDMPRLIEEGP